MIQQWLFVSASGQQLSANEPEVPALAQSGQIGPQTLMWREGMAQWVPAASVFPALFVVAPMAAAGATQALTTGRVAGDSITPTGGLTTSDPAVVRRLAAPLLARKGWMKFLGVLFIIMGVPAILYLGLGLILIFAGIALLKVPGLVERAQATGDPAALEEANKEMSKYFLLHGITLLIYLVLVTGVVIIMLAFGLFSASTMQHRLSSPPPPVSEAPLTSDDIRFPDSPAPPK